MTVVARDLRNALQHIQVVLFDFDGPLCDVFAGLPAWQIARELEALTGNSYGTDDPLEVLKLSGDKPRGTLIVVEHALTAGELRAIPKSVATAGGLESVRACVESGRRAAIVSNNSRDAVMEFLTRANLTHHVSPVIGRPTGRPSLMKPNPWSVQQALDELNCSPDAAIFVGDSMTDLEAAAEVGVQCVAYANKPGKREQFAAAGATVVIEDMRELAAALGT